MVISKKRFAELYYGLRNYEVAIKLGVSESTVRAYRIALGLKPKGKGNKPKVRFKDD